MARITDVQLRVVSQTPSEATLEVRWTTSFSAKEIAGNSVFDCNVALQNVDDAIDPDQIARRTNIGATWVQAQAAPVQKSLRATLSRDLLNEDWQLFGLFGDTTDEWRAEGILTPFTPPATTKGVSPILRREFQP